MISCRFEAVMNQHKKPIENFFKYMGLGFLISCIKTDYANMKPMDVLEVLSLTFMYNAIIGIWIGLAQMFGIDLYHLVKKNYGKNENRFCYSSRYRWANGSI
jgi:hypothetical protein